MEKGEKKTNVIESLCSMKLLKYCATSPIDFAAERAVAGVAVLSILRGAWREPTCDSSD